MNESAQAIEKTFREIGKEHGYESVSAVFNEFKDFKIKWRRSCGWIEFEVSDYLINAPENVLKGIAETIFNRICKRKSPKYSQEMLDYMNSPEFIKINRPKYLKRAKNLTRKSEGEYRDLKDSYQRLIALGLTEHDDDLVLTWTKQPNIKKIGYCSVLMKTIAISSIFDTKDIPAFVMDYVLYHELIHLDRGFDPLDRNHDENFRTQENMHPMHDEAEEFLKKLRLCLE